MPIKTVAVLSPGDMGHAVAQLLREHELRVVTCLAGRSARTRALSNQAGVADVPNMAELVRQSDVVLSITTSEGAPSVCQEVAEAMRATGRSLLFAECNAIAPQKARALEPVITQAGGRFVDASIIGSPPKGGRSPRFYASGPHAGELEGLREFGLDVRNLGPDIGQASGIKMCYAAMTKGSAALYTELLMAAQMLDLWEPLVAEFQSGRRAGPYEFMESWIPGVPAKARRWVSEMQEIEATFDYLGMTPRLFQGVADMYRMIGGTPLGEEKPETRDRERSLQETVRLLAEFMQERSGHPGG